MIYWAQGFLFSCDLKLIHVMSFGQIGGFCRLRVCYQRGLPPPILYGFTAQMGPTKYGLSRNQTLGRFSLQVAISVSMMFPPGNNSSQWTEDL